MITAGSLAFWIMQNRKNTAFKNYLYKDLVLMLNEFIDNNNVLCITGDEGEILGVVTFKPNHFKSEVYIYDILTIKKGVVKKMMQECLRRFKDYTLSGKHRTGRKRLFKDSVKLTNRLYGC